MIEHEDLGVDEDLGRRILLRARSIAPCLLSLEGDDRKNAIAVLKGVIAELPEQGMSRARALSRNGTSITFADIDTAFTSDAIASLQQLCPSAPKGMPRASFPVDDTITRLWPERRSR